MNKDVGASTASPQNDNECDESKTKEIKSTKDAKDLEIEELQDRVKRLIAEFENFKKRSAKDKENLYSNITSDIITVFLPIIDGLEKAIQSETTDETFKSGIELILKQFIVILATQGVEQIKAVSETFNPEFHEAVNKIQDDKYKEQEIVEDFRTGYKIGNKVIRHSMVSVAN